MEFSANVTSGAAPLPVSFTDLSLHTPTGWAWYFGDETYTTPWTQMSVSAGWSARVDHSSVVMPDGSIVVMGGTVSGGGYKNDVWRSTDNGATWTQVNASAGWSARGRHSSVAMPDSSIVLMGGQDSSSNVKNDVWRSMDNGATWTQVNASAGWSRRMWHSSVAMPDGSIVLMGGSDSGYTLKNDVWRSTDNGTTWTQVNASAGWSAKGAHSSVAMPDGSIVLMGGLNSDLAFKNDVWRSTDNGATWTQVNASAEWMARCWHSSVAMPDGSIVLIGGYDGSYKNDVWRSTDNGATWTQVNADAQWSVRARHSSVAMPDGSIVLMGGNSINGIYNDVWRFMPAGSSAQNPSHTYTTPGIYQVALQVYNAGGYNSTRKTGYITVTEPPSPSPNKIGGMIYYAGTQNATIYVHLFNQTPGPGVPAWKTKTMSYAGSPISYGFSTYNGTFWVMSYMDLNGNHTPDVNEPWGFAVNKTNMQGPDPIQITGNMTGLDITLYETSLMANFTANVTSGTAPLTVNFTDTSTGSPTDWNWSFGDGSSSTLQNPSHTYGSAGNYIVTLTATNSAGSNILTRTNYITVSPASPAVPAHTSPADDLALHADTSASDSGWGGGSSNSDLTDGLRTYDGEWARGLAFWYGEWHQVTIDFGHQVTFNRVIQWYHDGINNNEAAAYKLQYWNGLNWVDIFETDNSHAYLKYPDASSSDWWYAWSTPYENTFAPVVSDKLRILNYPLDGSHTWLYEVEVYSANSPVANFTGTPTSGTVPLTVTFTDSSTNLPTSWNWSFGDGTNSVLRNPVHTYTNPGNYAVSLNVTNIDGSDTITMADYIHVTSNASVILAVSNLSGIVYNQTGEVRVNVTTRTVNPLVEVLQFDLVYDPTVLQYVSYNDGRSGMMINPIAPNKIRYSWLDWSGSNSLPVGDVPMVDIVFKSILKDGALSSLDFTGVDLWDASTSLLSVTEIQNGTFTPGPWPYPIAAFATNGTLAVAPTPVQFQDLSTGEGIYSWFWEFGDGTNSTLQNPVHIYAQNGIYSVSLSATNNTGTDALVKSNLIKICSVPVANFTANIVSGYPPLPVQFNDTSTGTPISWNWTFGDGTYSTLKNPAHTYTNPGNYAVSLNVTNIAGTDTITRTGYIHVTSDSSVILAVSNLSGILYNQTGEVRVNVTTKTLNPLVVALQFDLVYDPTVIQYISSDYRRSGTLFNPIAPNKIRVIWMDNSLNLLPVGDVPIIDFTFKSIRKDGLDSPLDFTDVDVIDWDGNPLIPVTEIQNGTFTPGPWISPSINFTANVTSGAAPLAVQFYDNSTGTPISWNWSFGDGTLSIEQNPLHTYTFSGTFSVSLNGTNAGGSNVSVHTNYIVVNVPKPFAEFSANVTSGAAPLAISFADLSSNNPTGWAWYFGDEDYTTPWTQVTASAGWTGRRGHSSVAMPDGSIVLMGGRDSPAGVKNDVWRSTDNGATWTQVTAGAVWSARWNPSSVAMPDGSIVLMGGWDGLKNWNDVWRSTDNGATWTQVTASAGWTGRRGHSSVAMPDGSIVLTGGYDGSNFRNDTWRSTDNGATWTQVNGSAGWTARAAHTSVAMPDGSIVLMGGNDGSNFKNDVWRSTDNGATWTQVTTSAGWTARIHHSSVAMPDGSIVLMGGYGGSGEKNDVWRSTDNGATWTQVTAGAGWSGREGICSVAMPDGSIVLTGGYDGSNFRNDVWRLMPAGSSAQNPSHTYTTPGIYPVALQAYNAGGYNSTRKTGYITVTGLPMAQFSLGRNAVYLTEGDMITRGNYTGEIRYDLILFNEGDASHTTLGNLTYELDADNITIPDWSDYAVWNATHAVWRFPSQYVVVENASFRTGISSNYTEGVSVNANMSRACNQTLFKSTGYQLVIATVEFSSVNASGGYWWRFIANPGGAVNPTFVPGSLVTDIPLRSVQTDQQHLNLDLNASALQPGITYTTSCIVRVEPTGGLPVVYKPKIVIGQVLSQNTTSGGVGYSAEMPAYLLPDHIHSASVSTNVSNAWTLTRLNQTFSVLQEVSEQQGLPMAQFTANMTSGTAPLTVQFYDNSTGLPTAWNWSFGDGHFSILQNPVHTYPIAGNYTVSLNVSGAGGFDKKVKTNLITVNPGGQQADHSIILQPGWNFISTPRTLENGNNTAMIFKDVSTESHTIWLYDASGRRWTPMTASTKVRPLDGIWIFSTSRIEVPLYFTRNPIQAPPTKQLFQGWNAIGFSDTIPASARATLLSVRNEWTQLIGYDAAIQQYEVSIINGESGIHSDSRSMVPTKGYWLYITRDRELASISS